jgi:hypothetical protein
VQGSFVETSVWLAKDHFKRVQLRIFPQEAYELRFIEGNDIQGCVDITPEDFRAVLHDYFRFSGNGVSLSYENRHVIVKIQGKHWAEVPDVDLMRLENMALSGEYGSFDSLS